MLLGELLTSKFGIDTLDVERALQFQSKYGGMIGSILINMGIISEETLVAALSEQLGVSTYADLPDNPVRISELPVEAVANIDFLMQRSWTPLFSDNGAVAFAACNPLDFEVIQHLSDLQIEWKTYLVTESQFRELQGKFQMNRETDQVGDLDVYDMLDAEIDKLRELASEAPIVNLVNSLISRAVMAGASDLHFEPYKSMYRVRFRIDGILHDIDFLPLKMQLPIASRIKILAGLDIAERRRPQDGQITMRVSSKNVDIRVSTLPLAHGESLVLRFLVTETVRYELDHLGLEPDLRSLLEEDIKRTSGVILLTGPTGSGKTTTLYSCLNKINDPEKKIITVEDPVEYQLEGVNQIQVHSDIGYDFLAALRSILRQDPDILMIGEIRDAETARVAMQASLTGHLVFSTLHTLDAPTAYTRLIDLELEEYLMNSSLISVIAQRLVRRVCPECVELRDPDSHAVATHNLEAVAANQNLPLGPLPHAVGCPSCNHTGYKGRLGLMEYLRCSGDIKSMPKDHTFFSNARSYMKEHNIRSLMEDGCVKVIKGHTTLDEVLRVAG